MSQLYKFMVAAPSKGAGAAASALGLAASIWPDWFQQKVGDKMTSATIQQIGVALLAISAAYFFLLWWLKPSEVAPIGTGVAQTTSGNAAHAIVNHGTLNIGATTAVTPDILPPRRPIVQQLSQIEIDIARAGMQTNPARLAHNITKPKADMPLAELLIRVHNALGPTPEPGPERKAYWSRVNLAIADKVAGEELHTWGRFGQRALAPIETDHWQNGTFDHRKGSLHVPVAYSSGYEMTDLHFCKAEIGRIWPDPQTAEDNE